MKPNDLNLEQQISAESALKKTNSQTDENQESEVNLTEIYSEKNSTFSGVNPMRERLKSKLNKTVSDNIQPESVTSAATFVTPPEIAEAMPVDVVQKVEESPEQATQAAHDAIKIDNGRAAIFSQAANLINEGKTQELDDFLKSPAVIEMMAKDTSFNQFSAIATPIASAGEEVARPQDKQELLGKLSEIFGYLGQEVYDVENKEVESTKLLEAAQKINQEPRFEKLVAKKESIIPAPEEQTQVEEFDKSAALALDPNADFNKKVEEEAKKEEEAKAKGRKREITDANVKDVAIGVGATALAITACVMMPPFGIFVAGAIMYAASTQMSSKEKDGERDVNLSEIEDLDLVKISDRFQVAPAETANQTEDFVDEAQEALEAGNAELSAANVALHQESEEEVKEPELNSAPTIIAPQVEGVSEEKDKEVEQSSSEILTPQATDADEQATAADEVEAEAAEVVVGNQPQIALDSSQQEQLGNIMNSLKSSATSEKVSDTNAHLSGVTKGQNGLGI